MPLVKNLIASITSDKILALLCGASLIAYFISSRAVSDMLKIALKIGSRI